MDWNHIPKIELHCHLDGSVRPETIIELAKKKEIKIPSYNLDEIKEKLIAPEECDSLDEYLKRFDLPLKVMQDSESINRITFELLEDAVFENVKYIEIRFAPVLHTNGGLSQEEAIKAVEEGILKAEKYFNIEANIIVCCMKHLSEDEAIKTIKAAKNSNCKKVKAIDLAGGEDEGFADKFINAMDYAYKAGFHITIHAGEAAGWKNVIDSIKKLHAERIGHGVRIIKNKDAMDYVKENNIMLEICPTSNVQTKAVENIESHPIKKIIDYGIPVSLNTDNRTVSNTSVGKEISLCSEVFDMNTIDFLKIYMDSVKYSFAEESTKEKLISIIEKNYPEALKYR